MFRYLRLWLLVRVCGRLPVRPLYALGEALGWCVWFGSAQVRATTTDHMRHALGNAPPDAIARAARSCMRTASQYYADFARAPYVSAGEALSTIDSFEGLEHFFEVYDRGCGVIVCSGHLGNPEFLVRAVAALGVDLLIFTEPLEPRRVHDFVHEVRRTSGGRFLPGGRAAVREAIAHLRAGGVVAVLADRDVQKRGRPVPFFGERARLPSGPVELALRTGAAVVPAFGLRAGTARYRIVVDPALRLERSGDHEADVDRGMLAMARALEAGIRRAPEQWFVLHPVWSGLAL